MSKTKIILGLIVLSSVTLADEEQMDAEFLEWLGLITEVEELGVDIDKLLDAPEQLSQSESDEEDSK